MTRGFEKVVHFRSALRFLITIFLSITFLKPHAQTLGGNAAYNFLKFSYATSQTAAGGVAVSQPSADVALALNNPALLRPALHAQAALHFTHLPAGIKGLHLASAYHDEKRNTTFGAALTFIQYGSITQTDAAGNVAGRFHPVDYQLQLSAARHYLERWQYGATFKFIQSSYQTYRSVAVAVDVGVQYLDSAKGWSLAVLAKNMGMPLKGYAGAPEELPFDLQWGVTKKLADAPLAFSISAQQLHRFNLLYNDTLFNSETGNATTPSFGKKLLHHVVVAAHLFISRQLEATVGYNPLRRYELSLGTAGNGLAGFSAGFTARFEKLHISYARSAYQRGIAGNQLGLNLALDRFFGVGKF
jgi:hypothetical protein